jgi:hypothetical protein
MNYSTRFEKRVTVQTYKPTAASLMALLKEHDDSTDTELSEWAVDIECIRNEPLQNMLAPANKFRWEITLTRSIK